MDPDSTNWPRTRSLLLLRCFGILFLVATVACTTSTSAYLPTTGPAPEPAPETTVASAPAAEGLIGADDLSYEGSFTVPDESSGTEDSLAYGGYGLAFNPANNSLFITGHDWHQLTAEISIPPLVPGSDPASLNRAVFVKKPQDAADGKLKDISTPADPEYARVGGYLVDGDSLIVSAFDYYDASGEQSRSHLITDTALGPSSELQAISPDISARWLGGPMAHIPQQWQAAFGGDPYIGGLGGVSIASNSSVGPAAATFSPEAFSNTKPASLVLGYPLASPLDVPERQSDLWNLTSTVTGIVFPERSNSVLFFGTQGVGDYCYGTGEECNDPINSSKGTHAYPYRYQVWAYDAADLAQVAAGEKAPESLMPYDYWELKLPMTASSFQLTGAAYDAGNNRIFIAQEFAEGTNPVVHVYNVLN